MAKRGPKRKPLDWNLLESLAQMQASCEYVSERILIGMGYEPAEIDRKLLDATSKRIVHNLKHRYGLNYLQFVQQKALEPRRIKLRQLQWKSAEAGNVTMQIWLGKQMLGQSDKQETVVKSESEQSRLVIEFAKDEPEASND